MRFSYRLSTNCSTLDELNIMVANRNLLILLLLFIIVILVFKVFEQSFINHFGNHQYKTAIKSSVIAQHTDVANNDLLVLYNRIPKTGSTSFMSVVYTLTEKNRFNAMFVNVSSTSHRFSFLDQYKFAANITNWKERKPAVYHGHFPFLNFNFLSMKQPLYINIVREPLERVVSHYYFVRYGDTYLPNRKRKYLGDKTTFDECVEKRSSHCDIKKLWLQIPYFCGSEPECWEVGSREALERAKRNVINYYLLVGITEQIDHFVEILETTLPSFFSGANQLFMKDGGVHIRKTKTKIPLEEKTIQYFHDTKVWKLENEFYLFIKKRFEYIYESYRKQRDKVSYIKVRPIHPFKS